MSQVGATADDTAGGGLLAFLREIAIVARYEIASLFLSVRALLFVVSYGVIAGGVGRFYLWADEKSQGAFQKMAAQAGAMSAEDKATLAKQFGASLADAFVSGDLPLIVLVILFLSTFALPGLVLLIGYGSIAEDVSTRFARFVLQRVRRETYLLGKIAGHFVVAYAAVVLVHLGLLAYASTMPNFDTARTLGAMPRIWLALAFFLLGYVAYTALFSALVRPPFAAFALGAMALFGLWILSFVRDVGRVWMGSWDMPLWALDPDALLVYAAHVLVLGGLAYVALRRRDV